MQTTKTAPSIAIIQQWALDNAPDKEMYAYGSFWHQIGFFRDTLSHLFCRNLEGDDREIARLTTVSVDGCHRSKSVLFPVYFIHLKEHGVKVWLRGNLYDWKVSVKSDKEITCDFHGIVEERQDGLSSCYFEGMENRCFPPYDAQSNRAIFSFALSDSYEVYAFFAILMDHLAKRAS